MIEDLNEQEMKEYIDFFYKKREKPNWLSIKLIKNRFFSRRIGIIGVHLWGYSIRLRLFGKDLL